MQEGRARYSAPMKYIEGDSVAYLANGSVAERMRALRVDSGPILKQGGMEGMAMAGPPQPSPPMPPDPAMAAGQQQMPMNVPGPNGMGGGTPLVAAAQEIEGIMDASILTIASAEELLSVSRDANQDDLAMASQALHSLEGTLKQIKHTELGIVAELFRKVQAGIEKNIADQQLTSLMGGGA